MVGVSGVSGRGVQINGRGVRGVRQGCHLTPLPDTPDTPDTPNRVAIVYLVQMKKIAWKLWWVIPPQSLENLYQSMPRCMQAIIDNQGGQTKY